MGKVAPILKELYDNKSLRENCSGFFKKLMQKLGIPGYDDLLADEIIEKIASADSGWIQLTEGADGTKVPAAAATAAAEGYLVIALLKAAEHDPHRKNKKTGKVEVRPYEHGHLVVVIDGPLKEGYPLVVSGSIIEDGRSDGSKAVLGVWRRVDAPKVKYYRWPTKFPILLLPPR